MLECDTMFHAHYEQTDQYHYKTPAPLLLRPIGMKDMYVFQVGSRCDAGAAQQQT